MFIALRGDRPTDRVCVTPKLWRDSGPVEESPLHGESVWRQHTGLGAPNGEGLGAGDTAVSTLGHLGGRVPEVRPRTQPLQLRTRGPEALGDCEPWRGRGEG